MKKILFVSFLFCSVTPVMATHNLSGDIAYRWISGNTYEITVHTFTKLSSPADRCELTLYFGDGDSALMHRMNGPQTICMAPDFDGVPYNANVKYNVYQVNHTYPGPGNYHLTMTDPNRASGLVNVPNSVNSLFKLEAFLYINAIFGPNSSPVIDHFTDLDTAYKWTYNSFNAHATDADGDSLVYELMAPPGTQNYVLPYNNFYFGCDSITGKISWDQPDSVGSFCFDVRIVEYRRISNQYYIVGQTMRDVYANVFLATSVNEAESGRPSFVVSPLPSGDKVNITFVEGTVFDRNSLQVFDVEGNKIEVKYTIQRSTFVIESNGLSPGLYMFLLNTDRSATVRGRFMIIE